MFDYDVFRQCFHIRSEDTGLFLPEMLDLVLTPATFIIGMLDYSCALCSSLFRVMDLISIL